MRIIDDVLLEEFRAKEFCEWCGRRLRYKAEPAHVFARGRSNGFRLDIRWNLVGLGGPWDCACHKSSHDGHEPLQHDLLAVVAAREGLLQDEIETVLKRLRFAPKRKLSERPTWEQLKELVGF